MNYTNDKHFDEIISRCVHILETKSLDYAEQDDRLAELRATSLELELPMRKVLGVYMSKHLRSLKKWIRGDVLKGEPIEEKIIDIIVYCLLAYKLIKSEERVVK